jgi:hypothetical protein
LNGTVLEYQAGDTSKHNASFTSNVHIAKRGRAHRVLLTDLANRFCASTGNSSEAQQALFMECGKGSTNQTTSNNDYFRGAIPDPSYTGDTGVASLSGPGANLKCNGLTAGSEFLSDKAPFVLEAAATLGLIAGAYAFKALNAEDPIVERALSDVSTVTCYLTSGTSTAGYSGGATTKTKIASNVTTTLNTTVTPT